MSYDKSSHEINNVFRVISAVQTETQIVGSATTAIYTHLNNTRFIPVELNIHINAKNTWTGNPGFSLGTTLANPIEFLGATTITLTTTSQYGFAYNSNIQWAGTGKASMTSGSTLYIKWTNVGTGTSRTCNLTFNLLCLEFPL